jgi:hypothetical protein
MAEFEIGSNMVAIISLIINAVIVPLFLRERKNCKHLRDKVSDD